MAPASTPDKYPPPEAFQQTFQVTVGSGANEKTFGLHKGVVEFYSGYLEGALRGGFAEALSGKITLPEEDATTFGLFVLWLYTRRIDVPADASAGERFSILCDLWLLADRRQVPLLMNASVDAMRDAILTLWIAPTSQLNRIIENTTPEAGMRRFCVAVIANSCDTSVLDKDSRDFSREGLLEIMKLVWKFGNRQPLTREALRGFDLCQYHWHEDGETCKGKST